MVLTVLFCVCLIVANLVEIKTVALGPLTVTAGMVVFPVSYIINDCLVEVYGFRKARPKVCLLWHAARSCVRPMLLSFGS